jgi:hypothetical protein
VFFISDTSRVFDKMKFISVSRASTNLGRNGFTKYEDDKEAQKVIAPPDPPFFNKPHPNGEIYSSGKIWQ